MDGNILRQIEVEDIVFFTDNQYDPKNRKKYLEVFEDMVARGRLTGNFSGMKWMGYSGVKRYGIDFTLDERAYNSHFGKRFGISYSKMQDMLRCYVIYNIGAFIFPTINEKVGWAKQLLTTVGDYNLKFPMDAYETLLDFLYYIGTPEEEVNDIISRIHFSQVPKTKPRKLSHLINYLAIAHEIDEIYHDVLLQDDGFKKWFPIFFWTKVTFVIPLRATEMLVTPLNCIRKEKGKNYLTLRRTQLKGKKRVVQYQVEKDYKEFEYEYGDQWVVEIMEKYQELTSDHPRKYLFDHTMYMINNMVSLQSFNMLLAEFVQTYLVDNPKYDYAKYAAGIKEFDLVTAGDSRPIAMSNLHFQDISADVCRQLADHSQISTSFGYYTNVSNTIHCASIMTIQKRINRERRDLDAAYAMVYVEKYRTELASVCHSPRQPLVTGDITDCQSHLHECLGCKYYSPAADELQKAFNKRKEQLDAVSKQLVEYIADTRDGGDTKIDIDKLFLDTHTGAVRFKQASDKVAKEAELKWRRLRNTQTTY